jgi:hypothetical protein
MANGMLPLISLIHSVKFTQHSVQHTHTCSVQLSSPKDKQNESNMVVFLWLEFLATDPEVPGSISGVTRFSEK